MTTEEILKQIVGQRIVGVTRAHYNDEYGELRGEGILLENGWFLLFADEAVAPKSPDDAPIFMKGEP